MTLDQKFMHRCLQLAKKGEGFAKPNPMVGAVIVHNGQIIGEGYHRQFGEAHAEVNAIRSVKNPSLLSSSTMYVSLEPCAHHGKTPPCAELIIEKKIPKVIIAVSDPNPKVSGKGVAMLQSAGINVTIGTLQKEAEELNRVFFVNQLYSRPYIILKWAQTTDGFIDHKRLSVEKKSPAQISNKLTHSIVHKFRTQVQGIMVGTNTALLDNPKLTARKWFGNNPTRIVIDKNVKIPADSSIFNDEAATIVFTQQDYPLKKSNIKSLNINFEENVNKQILQHLYQERIYSVLVEGGARLLSSFIEKNLWDEAYVEISDKKLISGVKAPEISMDNAIIKKYLDSAQHHLKNKITQNFL
ncbi:MAG: bifunctional diaminohydroxyphosphoribosylaminopyrimidine deaminase/5-amino-6-(5-phosphoribosylamino)uracil reductase RibD [Bacteroidia bacterium]|nr:bifunctional diaminohydroxyphosphoribosylaminopyrimidine deaminase/5-amino-6-(5-phosphoribosylamino)uracil reductase RibD [Bacteroidia bacterium]